MNTTPDPATSEPAPFVPAKVIAVGNAGLKVVDAMISAGFDPALTVGIDIDGAAIGASKAGHKLHLDSRGAKPAGTGGDPARARVCAEEQSGELKKVLENTGSVLLVASLGGGAGTGIVPVLARTGRECGARVIAFAILPFECEGNLRSQVAQAGLRELKEAAELVVTLPNEKALGLAGEGASLIETFRCANDRFATYVATVWRALLSNSVIGIRFADMCTLLRQRSTDLAIAVARAGGTNRAQEAVENVLADPMLGGPQALQHLPTLGVCTLGGPSLAATEVSRILDTVRRTCGESPVLMSAGISPDMAESLSVLLLATRPEEMAEPAPEIAQTASAANPRVACNIDYQLISRQGTPRPHSRFVPPPPNLPQEKLKELRKQPRKALPRMRQTQLPLEIVSKGRFDKSEPTIHKGEDLDVPTYIRRGVVLN